MNDCGSSTQSSPAKAGGSSTEVGLKIPVPVKRVVDYNVTARRDGASNSRVNAKEQAPAPQVGVGVIVLRRGRVLLGKRKGSHGAGTWALPGGHLEFGESVEACAVRETEEEAGLRVEVVGHGPYTNDVLPNEGKHYVTVFVLAHCDQGMPVVREPEKCEAWSWFRWCALPSNLFQPLQSLVDRGYTPSGSDPI